MALPITKGKLHSAIRGVLMGGAGVGKSSLAAEFPNPLFLDIEKSTQELNVSRIQCDDFRSVEFAVKELTKDQQGFKTVVIDTADWLEARLIEHLTKQNGGKGIESWGGGFGKGYIEVLENFRRFLADLSKLSDAGVNVFFVAHTTVKKVSPPDQTDGYDRYELKLSKHVSPVLREWATLILFYNFKVDLVKGTDKKIKGSNGSERVIYTAPAAAWDAKNRYGLPSEILAPDPQAAFKEIAHIFNAPAPEVKNVTPPAAETKPATPPAEEKKPETKPAEPLPVMATTAQLASITTLADTVERKKLVEAALSNAHAVDLGELTLDQAAKLIAALMVEQYDEKVPAKFGAWLDANAVPVNSYLNKVKWITAAQTWRDLPQEKLNSIVDRVAAFARNAGIEAPK